MHMRKRFRQINFRAERGQSMTEFALVLPVLALLLFAIIQFGIVFHDYVQITDATRAGARKAAVSRDLPNPVAGAVASVRSSAAGLDSGNLDVTVSSSFERGADVTVTTSYPYSISLLGLVVKSGRITSSTTERVE
jgi:Flp pilus assembly protein TadG